MKLAIDGSGAVARWVAARLPHVGAAGFGPNAAIAVVSQDETIMAGVVFHDWQELAGTMQLSCAADTPRWATRRIVSALLAYPFVQLAVNKCWTATDHANARALRFIKGIGFKQEAILRHQFGGKHHAVICSMMRGEFHRRYCDGQEIALPARAA